MSAKEMFKKLRFKQTIEEDIIEYAFFDYKNCVAITFYKSYKLYNVHSTYGVTPRLHKAIHQQMKELEWLDE